MAVIKTQGTAVYVYDGTAVTKLDCITGIDLGGDSTTRIDVTCLDEPTSKAYVSGLSDPGEGSLTFNLDPKNSSHLAALLLAENKKEGVKFYVGASDGTGAITVSGSVVTVPTTRSWWTFEGSLSSPVPSFEADAVVGYTVTLNRSTKVVFTAKA